MTIEYDFFLTLLFLVLWFYLDHLFATCAVTWILADCVTFTIRSAIADIFRRTLYQALLKNHVDYVFVGSKEQGYPFAFAIDGHPEMRQVYNRDGVKIYKIDAP